MKNMGLCLYITMSSNQLHKRELWQSKVLNRKLKFKLINKPGTLVVVVCAAVVVVASVVVVVKVHSSKDGWAKLRCEVYTKKDWSRPVLRLLKELVLKPDLS